MDASPFGTKERKEICDFLENAAVQIIEAAEERKRGGETRSRLELTMPVKYEHIRPPQAFEQLSLAFAISVRVERDSSWMCRISVLEDFPNLEKIGFVMAPRAGRQRLMQKWTTTTAEKQ